MKNIINFKSECDRNRRKRWLAIYAIVAMLFIWAVQSRACEFTDDATEAPIVDTTGAPFKMHRAVYVVPACCAGPRVWRI